MWWKNKQAMKSPEGLARQLEMMRHQVFLLTPEKQLELAKREGNLEVDLLAYAAEKLLTEVEAKEAAQAKEAAEKTSYYIS